MVASPERPRQSRKSYTHPGISGATLGASMSPISGAAGGSPGLSGRADLVARIVGVQPMQWVDRRAGLLNGPVDGHLNFRETTSTATDGWVPSGPWDRRRTRLALHRRGARRRPRRRPSAPRPQCPAHVLQTDRNPTLEALRTASMYPRVCTRPKVSTSAGSGTRTSKSSTTQSVWAPQTLAIPAVDLHPRPPTSSPRRSGCSTCTSGSGTGNRWAPGTT